MLFSGYLNDEEADRDAFVTLSTSQHRSTSRNPTVTSVHFEIGGAEDNVTTATIGDIKYFLQTSQSNRWFRTGDVGWMDRGGYIYLCGRTKEMINFGGEKISPFEVEDEVSRHPLIEESIAFSVPHSTLGEVVGVLATLKESALASSLSSLSSPQIPSLCDIRSYLSKMGTINAKKWPMYFQIVKQIPRGKTGKPLRIGIPKLFGIKMITADPFQVDIPHSFSEKSQGFEMEILLLCRSLLGVELSADSDLFDVGLSSLTAIALVNQVGVIEREGGEGRERESRKRRKRRGNKSEQWRSWVGIGGVL